MEFDTDWITLGPHRVRLRCVRGFPTEKMQSIAALARIAIEHNMSAAARLLEVVADRSNAYTINVGTTFPKDKDVVPHLEAALATMYGLKMDQITMEVTVVSQAEVDLHFGVYERMLAEKIGIVPRIQ
ncbi:MULTISPECIES: hypothetical protein [unclassified Cupriavidus]|uniref:hypothetical protein n=1 Tax=unclassified Cupriavidus TaxID=2640874 RepID=UPI001C004AC7|nr:MULTISPECIES: hypothetical protein [unclassified Cupriavidus]MCA3187011.1 hypothetical protein [Cupriavidus sp.]MCA3191642.1 hypothetical protein [Cupriavidus sp.]MCA3200117.1 hypothetical protein [Cupriavidus sp.]MCA3206358.1 hypothetical protein [Cupriavidus sp.]QWE97104.1 hypothetical protein KLP38_18285 [Cupriavidus sp. EM10]